eukprot:symbB.v1.2.011922.t1/scaffold809.1/size160600/1
MWQAQAQGAPPVPPVVVINGGCAMKLPTPVMWPDHQVLFALIGGKDNFRSHLPAANKTTAILFVKEMTHMPQQHLFLGSIWSKVITQMTVVIVKRKFFTSPSDPFVKRQFCDCGWQPSRHFVRVKCKLLISPSDPFVKRQFCDCGWQPSRHFVRVKCKLLISVSDPFGL